MATVQSFIALGGNVGDVAKTFDRALKELAVIEGIDVGAVSSLHEFPAVGENAGDDFLNAACELSTTLSAQELLRTLQRVELNCGRTRERHWGPRTLDLDLILFGDAVIESPELTVPHPATWYRRFVLDSLAEIAGEVIHPQKRTSVAGLRERLLPRPLQVALSGGTVAEREDLQARITASFPTASCQRDWCPTDLHPALLFWLGPEPDDAQTFSSLPELPRIDVSTAGDPFGIIGDVLAAALGS